MAFMAAAAPYIAAASMAATAAGSAASMMAQKKRMNAIDKLRKRTSAGIEANRQQAEAAWKEALAKAAPEQQERMIKEQGGRSLDLYKAVVGDEALPGGGIIKMGEGAPKIVQTEAAKQLGNQLDIAKQRMAASANMAGYGGATSDFMRDLARTGEKIGMYGNFSTGLANAAETTAGQYAAAQPKFPLGDILSGLGQAGMQASMMDWGSPDEGTLAQGPLGKSIKSKGIVAPIAGGWGW